MNIRVMKFGGTSLRSEVTRKYVCRHILQAKKSSKIVAVVSAMGRYPDPYATDTLLSLGSSALSREEKARLVSFGEQIAALKVCSELLEMGLRAVSIPVHTCGIITDERFEYARVKSLQGRYIQDLLRHWDVAVVSGFIAMSEKGRITTLGRGGSDYSAVLFADMLGLTDVDIFTDVDGVYDRDPKLHEFALRYDRLSYDEMLNMKARVLHDRCVEYAREHAIRIHLKGTFSKGAGTLIAS